MPVLSKARESAKAVACMSQQRQLLYAVLQYGHDNRQVVLPASDAAMTSYSISWAALQTLNYIRPRTGILSCPSDSTTTPTTHYWPYFFTEGQNRSYVYAVEAGKRTVATDPSNITAGPKFRFWKLNQLRKAPFDALIWCMDPPIPQAGQGAFFATDNIALAVPYYLDYQPLHNKAFNIVFMDGHAARVTRQSWISDIQFKGDWN
jgi:prepilin-type processing-associated H-X9-DG protein